MLQGKLAEITVGLVPEDLDEASKFVPSNNKTIRCVPPSSER